MDFASTLAGDGKRRAELPSFGKLERGSEVDLVGFPSFGIEKDLVPTDDGEFVGGGRSGREPAFKCCGRKEVEIGIDFMDSGRNVDVDGESVEQVAAPFQSLTICFEEESGEIDHGAIGGVFTGNPFWVVEREISGSRGDLQRGMENLARSVRGVDRNGDGGGVSSPTGNGKERKTQKGQSFRKFHSAKNPQKIRRTDLANVNNYDYSSAWRRAHSEGRWYHSADVTARKVHYVRRARRHGQKHADA